MRRAVNMDFGILLFLICAGIVAVSFFICKINSVRVDIAEFLADLNSPTKTEYIVFDSIHYSLRGVGNARGLRIFYQITGHSDFSRAEWVPFGKEPIIVWK